MNQQENISLQIFPEHSVNNQGNLIKSSQITVFVDQHASQKTCNVWLLGTLRNGTFKYVKVYPGNYGYFFQVRSAHASAWKSWSQCCFGFGHSRNNPRNVNSKCTNSQQQTLYIVYYSYLNELWQILNKVSNTFESIFEFQVWRMGIIIHGRIVLLDCVDFSLLCLNIYWNWVSK